MKEYFVKNRVAVILIGILILAGFLRFYNLGEKSFSADEFLGVNTAYGYLQTGEWRRWDFNWERPFEDNVYFKTFFDFDFWGDGEDTYTRAWVYNWQVAQSLRFLPDSQEWSYRTVGVLWGILAVFIIYWVTLRFTKNKVIALLAAFLLAFSLDGIEFSRRMRMYIVFMPVFLLLAYAAFNFFESRKLPRQKWLKFLNEKTKLNFIYFPLLSFLGLLSMHLHLLTANFVFVALVYFLVLAAVEWKKTRSFYNHYFFYSALAIFMAIVFFIQGNALTASLNWQKHFSYLNNSFFDYANWFLAGALLLLGAFYLIKEKTKAGIFIFLNYAVILFLAVFLWDRNVGAQYLFFIKPFQIILIATGIWRVADFLRENAKAYSRETYLAAMGIILALLINFGYFFQEENAYRQTSRSENPDYKKVFGYVLNHRNTGDVLITRAFRNFYWQGAGIEVYSMGGERAEEGEKKITLNRLKEIIAANSSGWIVYSDNDENFISKEAQKYMDKNLTKINNLQVRGPISVYHWGENKK